MSSPLALHVSQLLKSAASRLSQAPALVGFDGFVDTILHVVAQRQSASAFTRMEGMRSFSEKVNAAAGLSANFEFVTQRIKLGGNGPIMANALHASGMPVTYIGNLGFPHIHPIFQEFSEKATVYSIAEPGYTDALEFSDGKLMCGKHESLKDVNWKNILACLPEPKLLEIFQNSRLISLVNWTMLTQMSAIWQKIATQIAPKLTGPKRWLFLDLADPAKRSREDIAKALAQISRFQNIFV